MGDSSREKEVPGEAEFKVTDRRLFSSEGELRSDTELADEREDAPPTEPRKEEPTSRELAESSDDPGFEHRSLEEPKGVDFTMLINAMAEPALLFLGEIPHPSTGQPTVDLERARIQVDMLDLLRIKCRGNLTREEESLLERILYQIRMLFVSKSNQQPDS